MVVKLISRHASEPGADASPALSGSGGPPGLMLEVRDVSKSFGETRALQSARLSVARGEIHSLAGENGSGKSTLMKVLAGVLRPDSGTVVWEGKEVRFPNPAAAQRAGISMVFQETLVVPEQTVRENILLGTDGMFLRRRSRSAERDVAREALNYLGLKEMGTEQMVRSLSLAEQQLVTIARAIARPWSLLVLDEATSALDSGQREQLFAYLRAACAQGRSVLFTSHRMDEVEALAESVSVLRLGSLVRRVTMRESNPAEILAMMAGREAAERALAPASDVAVEARKLSAEVVMRVQDLSVRRSSRPISLSLVKGEILGLGGLESQGQDEFADCLCGLRKPASGGVKVLTANGSWSGISGFADANRKGVAFVPRDRRHEGLFPPLSIFDNFGFGVYPQLKRWGIIRRGAVAGRFGEFAKQTNLKYQAPRNLIGTLSGGNQQKVLLGRWLATKPRILVLNDPMRGVDANTKEELYKLLRQLADSGLTVVLLSTEILELLTLCDRIAIFHEGSVEALMPAAEATPTNIVAAMFSHAATASSGDN